MSSFAPRSEIIVKIHVTGCFSVLFMYLFVVNCF